MSAIPLLDAPSRRSVRETPASPRLRVEASAPKARSARKARASIAQRVFPALFALALVTGATYLAVSLAGHVMVEKARRDGIRATERAREARRVEAALRQRILVTTSYASVAQWASSNGFVASSAVADPSLEREPTRVASR